jgi:dCTP deaminase
LWIFVFLPKRGVVWYDWDIRFYGTPMILSDKDIIDYIKRGRITVSPSPDLHEQVGPCSLDLHLGNVFKVFKPSQYPYLDLNRNINFESIMEDIEIAEDGGPFILQPKDFVLAITKEEFTLPDDLMARLDGRSSLGRLGIVVHSTAARFDPGWDGRAVMELGNLGIMPVVLYTGMRICALTFETLSSPSQYPYGKRKSHKYTRQETPQASKITREFGMKKRGGKRTRRQ